jgi:penicillin-binding protein 2
LFSARIRWIVAVLAALYGAFLCRVLYLQTFGGEEAREAVRDRLSDDVLLPPRRGTIRDADGLVLARDDAGFALLADPWGLGAVEWECGGCGRLVVTRERDPGAGAPDLPPLPAEFPSPCACARPGAGWAPTYAADRAALAGLLGGEWTPESFGAALEKVRREGWVDARAKVAGLSERRRRPALRERLARTRPVAGSIGREAAMEVVLHPERYPGLKVETRVRRVLDPGLDLATRLVVGRAGPLRDFDLEGRREEFEREGLTPGRLARIPVGRSGVERIHDADLRGSFGRLQRTRDFAGARMGTEVLAPAVDGDDLVLTLSAHLDAAAEGILAGRRGAIVAMAPRDGAILAFAGTAGVEEGDPPGPVRALDPGSVFKVLTAAVGLEGDLAFPAGEVRCLGRASKPVSCEHEHGSPGLREALGHSCNAYFSRLALEIGTRPLQDYARRLHVDLPFGLGVYGEGGGTTWTQETYRRPWVRTDLANLGIGQGPVQLSPIQVGALYCAVANGGRPVRPRFTEGRGAGPGAPVLSPGTLAEIRAGLEETVRSGTASQAGLGRFDAAGKTGTAQVGSRGCHAWFAGYAPAADPRVVVVVVLEAQEDSGGRAAAPLAAEFLEAWESWAAGGGGR